MTQERPMCNAQVQGVDNTLRLSGVIDHASVLNLLQQGQEFLAQAQARSIVVDWSAVTYANSAGLAMLLQWTRLAQAANKALSSQNAPEFLVQLAKVSQLEFLFARE